MIGNLAQKSRLRIVGLMSGTSMDGLDIAICDIEAEPFAIQCLASATIPFKPELKAQIASAMNASHAEVARLDIALGKAFAAMAGDFIEEVELPVDAAGCHGQTVFHEHGVTTSQIGEPGFLANRLGCPVIADFRRADLAKGGCGAPLVPLFDIACFGRDHEGVIALNIGGIANLTAIPQMDLRDQALAFDTGPGNMVIDGLTQHFSKGRQPFDDGGEFAAVGEIDHDLLRKLMAHPFLAKNPPRSAGREDFGDEFVQSLIAAYKPKSEGQWLTLIATATAWTSSSIWQSIERHVLPRFPVSQIIVAGGGAQNRTLMNALAAHSNRCSVLPMDQFGIDPDMREAMAFAFLAERFIRRQPGNLPAATGAAASAILGKCVLPN